MGKGNEFAPKPNTLSNKEVGFEQLLSEREKKTNSLVCLGIDPRYDEVPDRIKHARYLGNSPERHLVHYFSGQIDKVKGSISSCKLNSAYFEALADQGGFTSMIKIAQHAKQNGIPVIIDGKRGDTEETSRYYAKAYFEVLQADAVTINIYGGGSFLRYGKSVFDSIRPYVENEASTTFIWCASSNDGGGQIQDLTVDLRDQDEDYISRFGGYEELAEIVGDYKVKVYQLVAFLASKWNEKGNIGVVAGATYPDKIAKIRKIVGELL